MQKYEGSAQVHSSAWIFQAWASFAISLTATTIGICYLPVDGWVKGYVGIGTIFTVASTFSVAKTTRDMHESKRIVSRVDEAKLERILTEHDPFIK